MVEAIEISQATGKRLMTWGVGSISIGIILILTLPGTLLAGIGVQAVIWGTIDVVIASFLLFKQKEQSVEKISRTVKKNIYVDIMFQVAGLVVAVLFYQDPYMMGNGLGVIIQGFFLFFLDRSYYKSLKNAE